MKKEVLRLEKEIEVNDDTIATLRRQIQNQTHESSLLQENLEVYMDRYTKLKNELKVNRNDQTDLRSLLAADFEKRLDQLDRIDYPDEIYFN